MKDNSSKKRAATANNLPKTTHLTVLTNTFEQSALTWTVAAFSKTYEVATVSGEGSQATYTGIAEMQGDKTSFKIPAKYLDGGPKSFAVRGVNAAGIGPWSNTETVTRPPQKKAYAPIPSWYWIAFWIFLTICVWFLVMTYRKELVKAFRETFSSPEIVNTTVGTPPTNPTPACTGTNPLPPLNQSVPPTQCVVTQYVQVAAPAVSEEPRSICINNHDGGTINLDTRGSTIAMQAPEKKDPVVRDEVKVTRNFCLKDPASPDSSLFIGKQFTVEDTVYPGEIVRYTAELGWQVQPWTEHPEEIDIHCGKTPFVSQQQVKVIRVGEQKVQMVIRAKTGHPVCVWFKLTYIGIGQ